MCPCGIIKAPTFGYSLKSLERSSQNDTRQGIHEKNDLQDVLLCTQQCIQTDKQSGEIDIFYNGNPVVRKRTTHTSMYNIWHYVHISISMDMKYVNQWSQHTGSLNKDKKNPNNQKETDENSFKYFDIFPPRTSVLPFLNAKKQRRKRFNMH